VLCVRPGFTLIGGRCLRTLLDGVVSGFGHGG
jgi:hypothetical protein